MPPSLAAVTILVPSYEEGLAFFRDALGFAIVEDTPQGANKRWLVVAPEGCAGARIVLAVPANERQRARIGDHFLFTDSFDRDYERMRSRGVRFLEAPRDEAYGRVAVFADPWGATWDLLQPAEAAHGA